MSPCARPPSRRSARSALVAVTDDAAAAAGARDARDRTRAASTRRAAAFAPTRSSRAPTRAPGRRSRSRRCFAELVARRRCAAARHEPRDSSIRRSGRSCAPPATTARSRSSASATRGRSRPGPGAIPARHDVELDIERRTLLVPRGVELDLGATAKAWAADRWPSLDRTPDECGRARLARRRHRRRRSAAVDGWPIRIADGPRRAPRRPRPGRRDRRGRPRDVEHDRSALAHRPRRRAPRARPAHRRARARRRGECVSVAATSCVDANVAATAAIVLGDGGTGLARGAATAGAPRRVDGATSSYCAAGPPTGARRRDRHRSAQSRRRSGT